MMRDITLTKMQRSAATLLCVVLTGCAIGPDYRRPPSILPADYAAPTPDTAVVQQDAVIDTHWWKLFNDGVLDDLVAQAFRQNADLRTAVARVEQAEAAAREAGAVLFPQLDGTASAGRNKISTKSASYIPGSGYPPISSAYTLGLTTAYEIDLWGRVRRADEVSRANLLSSEYSRAAVMLTVAGMVASNYLALRAYDAQLAVSEETVQTRRESLSLVGTRFAAGLVSPMDVYQAESVLAAAQAQLAEQRRLRALSEHQLALLTGNPQLKIAAGDLSGLPLPPLPPTGLPSDLIEARPDVRQAEAQLIASNAQIGLAKAGYFPKFTLTGSVGTASKTLSDFLTAGSGTWGIGLNLLTPILDFGRTTARVDQAKAVNQQALIAWQSTLQTAYKEVRDALVTLSDNADVETSQNVRADRSKKVADLARLRYQAGQIGYLEMLDAQRAHYDAQLALIAARQARLMAAVSLFRALGGGWKPDFESKGAALSQF